MNVSTATVVKQPPQTWYVGKSWKVTCSCYEWSCCLCVNEPTVFSLHNSKELRGSSKRRLFNLTDKPVSFSICRLMLRFKQYVTVHTQSVLLKVFPVLNEVWLHQRRRAVTKRCEQWTDCTCSGKHSRHTLWPPHVNGCDKINTDKLLMFNTE